MSDDKNWLPEKFREDKTFEKYQTLEAFAEGHKNLVGLLGNSVKLPDPTDEAGKLAILDRLGAPKDVEAYKDIGNPAFEPMVKIKEAALKAKIMPDQLKAISQTFDSYVSEAQKGAQNAVANSELELRQSWGDKYEANTELVKRTVSEWGDSPLTKTFMEVSRTNPKLAHEMAYSLSKKEDSAGKPGIPQTKTAADLKNEAAALWKVAYGKDTPVAEKMAAHKKIEDIYKQMAPQTA